MVKYPWCTSACSPTATRLVWGDPQSRAESDEVLQIGGAALGPVLDVVDVDDGSPAAEPAAASALAGDDGLALCGGGQACGAADVEDGVLAGGQDRGQRGVAEHLLELGRSDGSEAGEVGRGGVDVVGQVGEVDGEGDVGADALVLRQPCLEDRGEELVEGGDAAFVDGAVVLGTGGCGERLQDGRELRTGVERQEARQVKALSDRRELDVVLGHALDPGLVEVVRVGSVAELLDRLAHLLGLGLRREVQHPVHRDLHDGRVDVTTRVGERVSIAATPLVRWLHYGAARRRRRWRGRRARACRSASALTW